MVDRSVNIEIVLINGLKNGNHSSFKKLYDIYASQLYNFSFKLLKSKDASEDIVQGTFLKIWQKREKLKTSGSFRSLLMTIALNDIRGAFNKISQENGLKNELLFQLSKSSEKYSQEDNYEELVGILESLVSKLPEKRKLIFTKKKLEGKKAKEIAIELNVSEKTVEYHVSETMKYLKTEFNSMGVSGTVLLLLLAITQNNNQS